MALIFPPPLLHHPQNSISRTSRTNPSPPNFTPFPSISTPRPPLRHKLLKKTLTLTLTPHNSTAPSSSSSFTDFDIDDPGEEDPAESPWEGAVVYRRDASVTHLEHCTTLERLGLGRLSTALSRSRASAMGIRLPPLARRAKDSSSGDADGTPVLISLDVTRRKRRLKLDGILRTVITLGCNRCAEPAAEGVFSNFTLLLTEDPIEEPDEINMGTIFGEDKNTTFTGSNEEEEDENEIDPEDRLYFPSEEKEIDISKQIRDIVHVEITINAICDTNCKGLCLKCGTNLNKRKCSCDKVKVQEKEYGPLKGLRKQMQES